MKFRLRRLLSLLLFATISAAAFGQDKNAPGFSISPRNDDGCGSPMVESQTYGFYEGRVTAILGSNKFVVKNELMVTLVGIDPKANSAAIRQFLNSKVLG